jgi:hypothetical protein
MVQVSAQWRALVYTVVNEATFQFHCILLDFTILTILGYRYTPYKVRDKEIKTEVKKE